MVDAFNTSQTIYLVISSWSNNIFGSIEMVYLFIIMLLISLAFAFRIPIEFTAILVLPLMMVFAAFQGSLLPLVYTFLVYGGILLYKYFLTRV